MSTPSDTPCQVPLIERLRSVPITAREMVEVGQCHHRNIPYGAMCHEAADRLTQLAVAKAEFEKLALLAAQTADRNVELRFRAEKAEAELVAEREPFND